MCAFVTRTRQTPTALFLHIVAKGRNDRRILVRSVPCGRRGGRNRGNRIGTGSECGRRGSGGKRITCGFEGETAIGFINEKMFEARVVAENFANSAIECRDELSRAVGPMSCEEVETIACNTAYVLGRIAQGSTQNLLETVAVCLQFVFRYNLKHEQNVLQTALPQNGVFQIACALNNLGKENFARQMCDQGTNTSVHRIGNYLHRDVKTTEKYFEEHGS